MNRSRWPLALITLVLLTGAPMAGAEPPDLWRAAGVLPARTRARAPAFVLPDLAGQPIALERYRGRVVMLYFWATW